MSKTFSIEEYCNLFKISRQSFYNHIANGLKVTKSSDHHLHKVQGEKVITIAYDDIVNYLVKAYKEGKPKALSYLLTLKECKGK